MPVYFQACQGASPIKSGVNGLAFALILGVFLMITGVTVAVSKKYRIQLWTAWVCFVIALGLIVTVHADTPLSRTIGFTAFLGFACGIIYSSTYYPVLAPLSVADNAHALALFAFFRSFAAVCVLHLILTFSNFSDDGYWTFRYGALLSALLFCRHS